jgi:CRISPR-associated exonuclease Cas4
MSNDSQPPDTGMNWPSPASGTAVVQTVRSRLSNQAFAEWYQEQQIEENILNGQAYFNGPSPPKDPDRHSPSKLLQCHRKAMYDRRNAPSEGTPPEGLFWIGSEFEEQVIVPFLQDVVTTEETYVQNSVWIDTEVTIDGTTVRVRGSTDPVVVTADADPVFVTEIKTTKDTDHLSSPKPHHKAQLHAYLYALNQEYDHEITDGMLVYGSRTTFDIEAFPIEFDPGFWADVEDWLGTQVGYEQADTLPPATPERDWECSYCSYKHRCGEADSPYSDIGVKGLLPLFDDYGKQPLVEYLKAHSDQDAKLTPTLAHSYPDLVQEYGAYDWSCVSCGATYAWDELDWDGDTDDLPVCPTCLETGDLVTVSGPEPDDQLDS